MSLKTKEMIKEAFSKKKFKSQWSPNTQINLYQLDIFLQKSGYRLIDVMPHKLGPELFIEPFKEGYLYPDITHDIAEGVFYIATKKYGGVTADDLEGIIQGYETAIGVVRHLEELDLSSLEIDDAPEEDEELPEE